MYFEVFTQTYKALEAKQEAQAAQQLEELDLGEEPTPRKRSSRSSTTMDPSYSLPVPTKRQKKESPALYVP